MRLLRGLPKGLTIPEENLLDKIEVIKWMYINDIL